ncbi:uncharacterized protein LOC144550645 [Carex rostrata]
MVNDYVAGEDETPVPIPNDEVETLHSAGSSFTAWPKDMISSDEEPCKELQVPTSGKLVHSDGLAPNQYMGFQGINFDKLGLNFKNLHDRFVKQVGNTFDINLPLDLFHSEDPISYAHKYYKDEFPNELVGFMNPVKTFASLLRGDDQDR